MSEHAGMGTLELANMSKVRQFPPRYKPPDSALLRDKLKEGYETVTRCDGTFQAWVDTLNPGVRIMKHDLSYLST